MSATGIEIYEQGGAVTITLDRPPLNIMNMTMLEELRNAVRDAVSSRRGFIVFKARGKAFSAGVDVADHLPDKVGGMMEAFHGIFRLLASFDGISLCCVHGPALGGGCELAMAADLVLASSEARFAQPEILLGVFPPVAAVLLPRLAHPRAAMELILGGEAVDAPEARRLGLVNKVFEAAAFEAECRRYLERLQGLSSSSLAIAKAALRRLHSAEFERDLGVAEEIYMRRLMSTKDAEEGSAAFMAKRKPVWTHG